MNDGERKRRLEIYSDLRKAERNRPANVATRVSGMRVIIEECVLCDGEHSHGHAYDLGLLDGGKRRPRAAHCTDENWGEEYDIVVSPKADGREEAVRQIRESKRRADA